MSKVYDRLDDRLIEFIRAQKVFFVATAPLGPDGHVNVSPKGYDSISIIDDLTVAWVDLGGSGIETQAHLRENGRITLMFCAFDGAANILRLYGKGEAVDFGDPRFDELMQRFPQVDKARAVVVVKIERIADSCGWGVPFYEFKGERDQLRRAHAPKPLEEWREYRYSKNEKSIDGLPGLTRPDAAASGKS
jgi:predicted pyridoxine 5'-phosphate oxidase superfamily flavin-nucleotide-binding protein